MNLRPADSDVIMVSENSGNIHEATARINRSMLAHLVFAIVPVSGGTSSIIVYRMTAGVARTLEKAKIIFLPEHML